MADTNWFDITKWVVETGGFGLAIFTAWSGFDKAHRDRKDALQQRQAALQQAKRDLEWRQTVEAQAAIRRMYSDASAQNAMTMLDWNARHFQIREGLRERITWNDMRLGLRTVNLRFTPKEVFIRNSFDALFDHFQMIQQQIKSEMFRIDDVVYPIAYYSRRIKHPNNWPAFERFLTKYNFLRATMLIEDIFKYSDPSGEADIEEDEEEQERS
jgi:hypothetical protein